ncbi:MAG: P-II family nitrogen regulator [Dehalococcoidales bacterium]|nr:P-II family nitrogen regulator [Dehalococcoidales bacterium]
MTEETSDSRTLIVTIVMRGWGDPVIEASMKAGAEGGTIVFGRGIGIHERKKIMGISVEPEKDIVLTITPPNKTDAILNEIVRVARLGEPGRGIAFTLPVDRFMGVVHTSMTVLPKESHP